MSKKLNTRIEKDSMGSFEVPSDAYYGANKIRAVINFPISTLKFQKELIKSLEPRKKTEALTNLDFDLYAKNVAEKISDAADRVLKGN